MTATVVIIGLLIVTGLVVVVKFLMIDSREGKDVGRAEDEIKRCEAEEEKVLLFGATVAPDDMEISMEMMTRITQTRFDTLGL